MEVVTQGWNAPGSGCGPKETLFPLEHIPPHGSAGIFPALWGFPPHYPKGPECFQGQVLEAIAGREEAASGQAQCQAVVFGCSGRELRPPLPAAGGRPKDWGSVPLPPEWKSEALELFPEAVAGTFPGLSCCPGVHALC